MASPLEHDRQVAGDAQPPLVIANEFAEVMVARVGTGNGVRLEVRSTRLGRSVTLDALALEALTWQEPSLFSDLLAEPFGPPPTGASAPRDQPVPGARAQERR